MINWTMTSDQLFGLFRPYILCFWPILQVLTIYSQFWPYFSVYGVGPVSECSDSDLQTSSKLHKLHQPVKPFWPVSFRLPEWEDCAIIISLSMPWVCLLCQHVASMPEVCQHARGSSQKCLSFPEVPDVLKAKMLCHCARWLKTHKTVLMA